MRATGSTSAVRALEGTDRVELPSTPTALTVSCLEVGHAGGALHMPCGVARQGKHFEARRICERDRAQDCGGRTSLGFPTSGARPTCPIWRGTYNQGTIGATHSGDALPRAAPAHPCADLCAGAWRKTRPTQCSPREGSRDHPAWARRAAHTGRLHHAWRSQETVGRQVQARQPEEPNPPREVNAR